MSKYRSLSNEEQKAVDRVGLDEIKRETNIFFPNWKIFREKDEKEIQKKKMTAAATKI